MTAITPYDVIGGEQAILSLVVPTNQCRLIFINELPK